MKRENKDTRRLDVGNYVALKFSDGWFMFNTIATEYNELKPVTLKNENGKRDVIAPETAGDDNDQIKDATGDRLLVPQDDERNLVYKVNYGIDPSRMQVFELFGRDRNRAIESYDSPGEPAPITTGYDSPYNNPTEEAEFFTVNDMEPPKLQAYNPTDTSLAAKLSFHITKLRFAVIEDPDVQKAIIQGQIPAKTETIGGGASDNDQVQTPQWIRRNFSSEVKTTEEILKASGSNGSSNGNSSGNTGDAGFGIPDKTGSVGGGNQ